MAKKDYQAEKEFARNSKSKGLTPIEYTRLCANAIGTQGKPAQFAAAQPKINDRKTGSPFK